MWRGMWFRRTSSLQCAALLAFFFAFKPVGVHAYGVVQEPDYSPLNNIAFNYQRTAALGQAL